MRREAREQARIDLFVDRLEQEALEEIDNLLHNEEPRDSEIFALMGADPEITIDEYEQVPVEDRDPNWVAGVAAMSRACTLQVLANHQDQLVDLLSKREDALAGADMPHGELKKAALDGIKKQAIAEEKERLANGD